MRTYGPGHFPKYPAEEQGARTLLNCSETPERSRHAGHPSQSERDWAYAKRALGRGDTPEKVISAIARYRNGEKSDMYTYATRTVSEGDPIPRSGTTLKRA